jgi:4-amino-4-deoxy-L-arabinose transferase-like glycosyltransferase
VNRVDPFTKRLTLILAAALALRLLYTVAVAGNEYSPGPFGDFFFFHEIANLIADGEGFVSPYLVEEAGRVEPTAEHPPLWPLLLAAASELGGNGLLAHRLVGVPVGVATVAVLALIGRRLGGDRAGLAVAAIGASHPLLIAADGSLMSETLYGLLVATALLLTIRAREEPTIARTAALGATIGLATLTRGEGLMLLVLLAAPVAWRQGSGARGRLKLGAAALVAALVVIAPWAIRNASTFERPVLISTNDGTVLTGANCHETYHGPEIGFWRTECRSRPREEDEAKQSAIWRREGLEYAGDHAGRLAIVIPVRLLRTWNLWNPKQLVEQAEGRDRTMEALGAATYLLLLPFAVYGAIALRRRQAPLWILLVPPLAVTLVTITAYGYTRFRHTADLAIVVLAGLALAQLAERRRGQTTGVR